MSRIRRVRQQTSAYALCPDSDDWLFRAIYHVEGEERELVCLKHVTPEMAEDAATYPAIWAAMDIEAQLAADNPIGIPTAHLVCR